MSEMVEKVARAIAVYGGRDPDAEFAGAKAWQAFEKLATASIRAMRDYTEGMSQVGGAVTKMQFGDPMDRVGCSIAERCYLAMIDAALGIPKPFFDLPIEQGPEISQAGIEAMKAREWEQMRPVWQPFLEELRNNLLAQKG